MTVDVEPPAGSAAQTQSFEADVSRLLHLMVHSVYSDRDIFVRELVSNAADACEKLRYEAIATPELLEGGGPFAITIAVDRAEKTLTFSDNGIGMSRADLVEALGTIARSGTRAFLDKIAAESADKEKAEANTLIGQFGIGFYSSFMVADEVVVETRRAGDDDGLALVERRQGLLHRRPARPRRCARPRHARDAASQRRVRGLRRGRPHRAHRARTFRRRADPDRHRRGAGRRAAPHRRWRRDLGEVEVGRHPGAIYRVLPQPRRPI